MRKTRSVIFGHRPFHNPPGTLRQAEPDPSRASCESSTSLNGRLAAAQAATPRREPDADEASPAPDGKLLWLTRKARLPKFLCLGLAILPHLIEKAADALQPLPISRSPRIKSSLQRRVELDGGHSGRFAIHGERWIGGQAQRLIAIAPAFDQAMFDLRTLLPYSLHFTYVTFSAFSIASLP
jgi:hypothetical protein